MNDQQIAQRGFEAQQLLDNPVLKEIWDGIEQEATEALVACSMKPDAKDERDALIWHLKMVRKQKAMCLGMIERGKFAQHQIDSGKDKEDGFVRGFMRKVAG